MKTASRIFLAGVTALWALGARADGSQDSRTSLRQLVSALKAAGPGVIIKNSFLVHAPSVAPEIRSRYHRSDVQKLLNDLNKTLVLKIDERGLVQASDRLGEKSDPTHYDAVWVRDSLWAYLALNEKSYDPVAGKKLLLTLWDYFSSPDQLERFQNVIKNPRLIHGPDGQMNVPHIRFDGKSPDFKDVFENGHAQRWNHKQNDALGLFLDLLCRAVLNGDIDGASVTPARAKVIGYFPEYFSAVRFYEMEDAGSWEEIERTNTSSMALVTSGLERLLEVLKSPSPQVQAVVKKWGPVNQDLVSGLIKKGYERVLRQIEAGGESPLYDHNDPRYRTADAALLNVIYPAQLARLRQKDYDKIIKIIDPLIGKVGIKRYLNDSYQSGNFWFAPPAQPAQTKSKTDDTSSKASFAARGKQFLDGSEAQWFFDSWYSKAMGVLHARYHSSRYLDLEEKFLNRSLAQITGGTMSHPVLGADGHAVLPMALPESYNTIRDPVSQKSYFVPSPITPLNWAKASLRLALDQLLVSLGTQTQ